MRITLIIAFLLFVVHQSFAQRYRLYPEMEISSLAMNEGELVLMNGDVIQGDLGLATVETSSGLQRINSVRMRKGSERLKFKAKEIKEIRIKANWSDQTLSEANSGDGLQIQLYSEAKADYYIFKNVTDKKGKPRLMQLLNPGFDHAIQVFVDPKSKDSAFASLVGKDTAKSYYLTRDDGQDGIYVKKSKYKKSFAGFFGDCAAIMAEFKDNIKWGDFAQHIYYYDQNCDE
ncbi:MAG: hypothetical protein KJP00_01180 [Bacteroidia bacterium]|nr:hypothetical protein [Bacteroidia bacterium]